MGQELVETLRIEGFLPGVGLAWNQELFSKERPTKPQKVHSCLHMSLVHNARKVLCSVGKEAGGSETVGSSLKSLRNFSALIVIIIVGRGDIHLPSVTFFDTFVTCADVGICRHRRSPTSHVACFSMIVQTGRS
jgi:hypothetical protein